MTYGEDFKKTAEEYSKTVQCKLTLLFFFFLLIMSVVMMIKNGVLNG